MTTTHAQRAMEQAIKNVNNYDFGKSYFEMTGESVMPINTFIRGGRIYCFTYKEQPDKSIKGYVYRVSKVGTNGKWGIRRTGSIFISSIGAVERFTNY